MGPRRLTRGNFRLKNEGPPAKRPSALAITDDKRALLFIAPPRTPRPTRSNGQQAGKQTAPGNLQVSFKGKPTASSARLCYFCSRKNEPTASENIHGPHGALVRRRAAARREQHPASPPRRDALRDGRCDLREIFVGKQPYAPRRTGEPGLAARMRGALAVHRRTRHTNGNEADGCPQAHAGCSFLCRADSNRPPLAQHPQAPTAPADGDTTAPPGPFGTRTEGSPIGSRLKTGPSAKNEFFHIINLLPKQII